MSRYSQVKDHDNLVRDQKANAIINIDGNAYEKRLQQIALSNQQQMKEQQMESDIDMLKSDIAEIKMLLKNLGGTNGQ